MAAEQMSRFARVPAETIRTCVDRLELQVSEEASSGLAEDTSFRIRQIADVSCTTLTVPYVQNPMNIVNPMNIAL